MRVDRNTWLIVLTAFFSAINQGAFAQSEDMRVVTIGSAGSNGTYYSVARAVCSLLNARSGDDLRCSPEPTPGSSYNLSALLSGELDFAIVQSDWVLEAISGTGIYRDKGEFKGLRTFADLYYEPVTFIARREAGVQSLGSRTDFALDIGAHSTARRSTNERLLRSLGLAVEDFPRIEDLDVPSIAKEICAGRIDATLLTIGHPNETVKQTIERCQLEILPIPLFELGASPGDAGNYFVQWTLPAGTYPTQSGAVEMVAVRAVLVTRDDLDADVARWVGEAVIRNHAELARVVPVLQARNVEEMRGAVDLAPLHPIAIEIYDQYDDSQN